MPRQNWLTERNIAYCDVTGNLRVALEVVDRLAELAHRQLVEKRFNNPVRSIGVAVRSTA